MDGRISESIDLSTELSEVQIARPHSEIGTIPVGFRRTVHFPSRFRERARHYTCDFYMADISTKAIQKEPLDVSHRNTLSYRMSRRLETSLKPIERDTSSGEQTFQMCKSTHHFALSSRKSFSRVPACLEQEAIKQKGAMRAIAVVLCFQCSLRHVTIQ